MSKRRDPSTRVAGVDEMGKNLSAAFARAEAPEGAKPSFAWRLTRPSLIAVGLAIAVAAVAFVSLATGGKDKVFSVDQALAQVVAGTYEFPTAASNGFLYVKSEEKFASSLGGESKDGKRLQVTVVTPITVESWTSAHRVGRRKTVTAPPNLVTDRARKIAREIVAANKSYVDAQIRLMKKRHNRQIPSFVASIDQPLVDALAGSKAPSRQLLCLSPASSSLTGQLMDTEGASNLKHLPTSPGAAYNFLFNQTKTLGSRVDRDGVVWTQIVAALRYGAPKLNQAQRAALVQAIGLIPGVKTLGQINDPRGRPAIGFERDAHDLHFEVYFDPTTSLPIYSSTRLTALRSKHGDGAPDFYSGLPIGTVTDEYVLDEQKVVPSLPAGLTPTKQAKSPVFMLIGCPPSSSRP